jgi:hypothetical protein
MARPVGGRGKRAPYDSQMMRVPTAIKPTVQKLVEEYRSAAMLSTSEGSLPSLAEDYEAELLAALNLVDRFTDLIGQSGELDNPKRRNNINLARFRHWLTSQQSRQDAP